MFFVQLIVNWFMLLGIVNATGCNETVEVTDSGRVFSRSWPRTKAEEQSTPCVITMTTDALHKLKVTITINEVQQVVPAGECKDDFISVGDSSTQQSKKICRKDETLSFDSAGSTAVLLYQFKTQAESGMAVSSKWIFTAAVKRVDPQGPCGSFPSKFDGSQLVFQFPMNKTTVEMPVTCKYAIESSGGRQIKATVNELTLRETPTCETDYLALGSDSALSQTKSVKICKMPEKPLVYLSDSAQLYVEIKVTDYTVNPSAKITLESGSVHGCVAFTSVTLLSILWLKPVF